ncbi:MAG: TlpA disulfide reductase family protein [Hyphomicrobiaceae bacterium]
MTGLTGLIAVALALLSATAAAAETGRDEPVRHLVSAAARVGPEFTLPVLDGSPMRLTAAASPVVLVHFFATWCEPCREELSSLVRLVADTPPHELTVLAVNVAEVPARVRRFIEATPVNFPILLDADRAVTRAWNVSTLPTTFVLGRDRTPRLFVEGDLDWTHRDVVDAIGSIRTQQQK